MDRIKVGVKIRPLIPREKAANCDIHWQAASDTSVCQVEPGSQRQKGDLYVFDNVFGPDSSNREVFEILVRPIVESAVRGFNGTIFAYGQTASGKTYTMMGDQYEPGIIPQAVDLVFQTIENTHGREFLLRVCYMEIYNEKVNDLLAKSNNLKVSEDAQGNVIVKELEEAITNSSQMVMDLMRKGENIRKIGVTNMNERSSRSHSIFRIIIESRQVGGNDAEEAIQVSHLNLVDLAGSERAGATGSVGDQFKEGCAINKSLFTLGKVISQLSDGEVSFVNFRDSKLTRILQSSLGGNALTSIICAITPAAIDETSSTLGFASRARNIKNKAQVNEVVSDRAMLKRYMKQIDRLNSALSTLEQQKNAENQHLQKENSLLNERLNRLKDGILGSNSELSNADKSKEKMKKLRRRTWSAPNRNKARLSLAFPACHKAGSLAELPNDTLMDFSVGSASNNDDIDNEEDVFSTPLEEFEKALIKAERAKSMDVGEWLPPIEDIDEDRYSKSPERDILETDPPCLNYVQTRRNKGHLNRFREIEVPDTPPSKLRSKIALVEQELREMDEFTRLEKQVYNEELCTELENVKLQLKEALSECESLKEVKMQLECLKQTDRTAHDYQMMLMDSSKAMSTLRDENVSMRQQLEDLTLHCQDLEKVKAQLSEAEKHLLKARKENSELTLKLKKHEESIFHLNNEKEDFDIQLQMRIAKYESRIKEMAQALEDARLESSTLHPPSFRKNYNGNLYSLQEEPSMEELTQQVQFLEEQCKELQSSKNLVLSELSIKEKELTNQVQLLEEQCKDLQSSKNLLVKELALKQEKLCQLEHQVVSSSNAPTDFTELNEHLGAVKGELEALRHDYEALTKKLDEKVKELDQTTCEMKKINEQLIRSEAIAASEAAEKDSTRAEITALRTSNDKLTKDLDQRNQDIINAAVEMEQLREQILQLQQDAKEVRNATDLHSSQNATIDTTLLSAEEQEALVHEVSVCKSEMAMQERKISSLEQQLSSLHSSSVDSEALLEELNNVKNQVKDLKESEDSLVHQIHERDCKLNEYVAETEKLRKQLRRSKGDTDTSHVTQEDQVNNWDPYVQSLTQELKDMKLEIAAANSSNEVVTKNLAQRNLEMEQLRDQILHLQQDAKDVKNATDLNSTQNATIDTTLLNAEEQEALINEVSVCKSKMAMQDQKISSLEQQISSLHSSSVDSESLLEELNNVKNQVKDLKINEDSLVHQIHKKDCKLDEYAIEMEKLRDPSCQSEGVTHMSSVTPVDQMLEIPPTAQSLIHELQDVKFEISTLKSSNLSLTHDLDVKNQEIMNAAVEMEQLREEIFKLRHNLNNDNDKKTSQYSALDTSLLKFEEEEALINEESVCKSEVAMQEQKMSSLRSSSVHSEAILEQLNEVKNQVKTLKQSEDSLVHQIHEKDYKLNENTIEMEKLMQELEVVKLEIIALKSSNTTLTKDLDQRNQDIVNAAVEMEQLRDQILLLQQDSKDDKNATDLHSSQNASIGTTLLNVEEQEALINEVSVCKSEMAMQEQKISSLEQQMSCMRSSSVDSEALLEELSNVKNQLMDLKQSEDSLVHQIHEKDYKLNENTIEMEKLMQELEVVKLEIIALKSSNTTLTKDLDQRNQDILNAAVEMEQLRDQILQLQQDSKDDKNATDLHSSQNATIDTTLLSVEKQEALINEVSVCKSEMAMQEQKISSLEQEISSMRSSSVDSEALLEELNNVKNQLMDLKQSEDSLVHQIHEKDCKLNEIAIEMGKLRDSPCQCDGFTHMSTVTADDQIEECQPNAMSLMQELEAVKLEIIALKSLNATLTKDLDQRNQDIVNAAVEMEQLRDQILQLRQDAKDVKNAPDPNSSQNATIDRTLFNVEEHKALIHEVSVCKSEMAMQEQKISSLEQQISSMRSSSLHSEALLEELSAIKNQVNTLKISEDSLVHQINERDCKLNEYAIEMDKLRELLCQSGSVSNKSSLTLIDDINRCQPNADSPILVPDAVEAKVDQEIVMSSVLKTDLVSLDIEKLNTKISLLENDLHKSRSLLWSNLEDVEIDESAPLHSLVLQCLACLTETKKKCTDLELRSQGQQSELQDKLSQELIQLRNELLTMKNDNNSLRLELDLKNSVLEDSELELGQLRDKVETLKSNSSDLQKLENISKEIVQNKNELEELQRKNSMLEDEIKYKNSLNLEVEDEVRQLKAKLHELANNLRKDEFCQKCCNLEKTIKNQLSEVESRDEKICTLQKHCDDLELEIQCAHRALLSEVKAISDRSDDLGNVSLSELLSIFLESIMKVQKHVASVFQTKLDSCTSELQTYAQQEAEWQETMKELKSNVIQLTEVNESLISQLGVIKQEEETMLIVQESFENSFKKLRSFLNCTQDLSQDELLSVVQSKVIELSLKTDEVAELNTIVHQIKTENDCLSLKVAETEKERKELQDKLSNMEYSSDQSSKDLKDLREKYEKSVADLSAQERLVMDLQSEALHAAECKEQLEKTQKRFESLSQELLTETALNATLKTKLSKKSDIVLNLEARLTELQLQVQTQSKQLSGKESLQSKASSLYNDLTEKKQFIVKLEEEIVCQKSILEEKQEKIETLCKEIEELKEKQSITEEDYLKIKNERDLAVKNLTLKPSPSDEVKELKAEVEFLNQQYQNTLKSSRETRSQNRKIKAELTKMKEKLGTSEKSTPGPSSELALLQGQLSQEISRRKQLEIQVEEQLTELTQLSRLKPSRVSDFKQKREASDARNVRSELESLREKYERNLKELSSKSHEVQALMKVVKEKEEIIIEKDKKIDEINKEKEDLDKECEDLLSWGRSLDQMNKELADRIAEILKDLAQTKSKLFLVTMDKIMVLRSSCKDLMDSLDKTTGDLLEMQLSSKEKSAKNAQSRAEALIGKLNDICSKHIDCDLLQDACSELHKENQFLSDVDDEFTTIWKKVCQEKKQAVRECGGCKELLEWGKQQEALAIENDNLVDRLNAEIKRLKCKEPSSLKNAHSAADKTSPREHILKCEELQRLVQTQRTELADKNAEITELKMKQQIQNKPAEDAIKRLEEKLKLSKDEIGNLKSQNRRILKTYQENTECASSVNVMTKSVHTQTTESNEAIYKSQYWSSGPCGIVEEANRIALEDKVRKLEREKETYKKLCIDRKQRMDIMEDKLKKYLKENQENEPINHGVVTTTPYSLRSRK